MTLTNVRCVVEHIFKNIREYKRNDKLRSSTLLSYLRTFSSFNEGDVSDLIERETSNLPAISEEYPNKFIHELRDAFE